MAMPGKKFADVVVARFTKKPTGEPDGDEGAAPDDGDADDSEKDGPEPGERGKIVLAAQRRGDPEALEEAIKAIVHDCLKEYGYGGDEK